MAEKLRCRGLLPSATSRLFAGWTPCPLVEGVYPAQMIVFHRTPCLSRMSSTRHLLPSQSQAKSSSRAPVVEAEGSRISRTAWCVGCHFGRPHRYLSHAARTRCCQCRPCCSGPVYYLCLCRTPLLYVYMLCWSNFKISRALRARRRPSSSWWQPGSGPA